MHTTQTPERPILLLDVDGVLNAFLPTRPHAIKHLGGREDRFTGKFTPFTLHFDNEVTEMIEALAEHFEIHWATMWNDAANTEISPALGIDTFPFLACNHEKGWDAAWDAGLTAERIHRLWFAKTPLIPEYVGSRRFAWLDDDHSDADLTYLRGRCSQDFFLCQTDANTGITWRDVADLIEWATTEPLEDDFATWDAEVTSTLPLYNSEPIDWDSDEVQGFLRALDNEDA